MPNPSTSSCTTLHSLHQPPHTPLVLTNIWDVPSARAIASLPSCRALATASYAIAIAHNTSDENLTLAQNLASIASIAHVAKEFDKPLTADIQDGYGARLEEVIGQLLDLGVAGCNLEDFDGARGKMYGAEEAAERVRRAMDVARSRGEGDFVVNARCDALLHGGELGEVIERGKAYLAAGATAVFVWGSKRGVRTEEVAEMVEAFGGRLSVKLDFGGLSVRELAGMGVARVSVGPSMQTRMMKALAEDARALLEY